MAKGRQLDPWNTYFRLAVELKDDGEEKQNQKDQLKHKAAVHDGAFNSEDPQVYNCCLCVNTALSLAEKKKT